MLENELTPDLGLNAFASLGIADFATYFQSEFEKGHALYRRMMVGPMDAHVVVRDRGEDRDCIMLGSNNYLGFANDAYIKEKVKSVIDQYGCGMSGPPLLNGHTILHRELEKRLAALKQTEDALLFPSGYQANLGIVEGCMRSGDVLIYDALSHASLIDGVKLSKAVQKIKAYRCKHNDVEDLERLLSVASRVKSQNGRVFVAVEGVYSMDGDIAPLRQITDMCDRANAYLILDDAHGTGVLGENGGGTCEHFDIGGHPLFVMGTFSKAFSVTGGFVCGPADWINYVRFYARPYLFSAHLPMTSVAAVLAGLDLIEREPERRAKCLKNAQLLKTELNNRGFDIKSQSPILPLAIPEDVSVRHVNKQLFQNGLFVNAVEYPAVALGSERLRISVSSAHSEDDMRKSASIISNVGKQFGMVQ